jgi:hypothetical protein
MEKHTSLLRKFVNYGRKKFYNIGAKIVQKLTLSVHDFARFLVVQRYKTFLSSLTPWHCKLERLVCSWVVQVSLTAYPLCGATTLSKK